jgi:putative ABC transport system permease protein
MNFVALKMLTGDRVKYIMIIVGLTIASFLITQQMGIFLGLMCRTFGFITDTALPDVWVMDPKVQYVDDIKPLQETQLLRVRGIEGVEWCMPLYKGLIKARLSSGDFQTCNVIGIDDATLVAGPSRMIEGKLDDLRRSEGVIVDTVGAQDKRAKTVLGPDGKPIPDPKSKGGVKKVPLQVGDTIELNDKRAVVVGICQVERTFQSNPVVYTTYTRALRYAPSERKLTGEQFKTVTYKYFMKYTGIPINFFMSTALGFGVGTVVAGAFFYMFTLDNIRHFGALKAMGTGNGTLMRMILLQSLLVGIMGYGIGVGAASLIGVLASKGELAFFMPWWLLVGTGLAIVMICMLSALVSLVKVMTLEPAIVFKG